MNISGSCLCGSVTYSGVAEPVMAGNCHCIDCKKASGSGYAPTLFFQESALTINGDVKYFAKAGDSGKAVKRGFCPNCGSQLFGKPDALPGLIAVRAGSLSELSQFKPQIDLYAGRAPAWDAMDPALPKFVEAPPMA